MSQSTKTPIVTYHSTVAAAVPSNANLQAGELAVNIADMKLYTENSSGTVTLLASADAAAGNFTTVDTTNLEVTNIKAKDGTAAIVLTNSTGAVTVSSPFATTGNTTLGNATADTVTVTGTITSNLIFTDNTYDIGASGATRPRDMFLAGNATIGGSIAATTLDLTNLEVTNIKAKDGTASASIADATGVMTIGSSVLTTTDINGGTIDATAIGSTTPAAGAFTTLSATSDALINSLKVGKGGGSVSTNTAVGSIALNANTTGSNNTAVGYQALDANTTGNRNSAFGTSSLGANLTGFDNTAIGYQALLSLTSGTYNTAVGSGSLSLTATGNYSTAVGYKSLNKDVSLGGNSAFGYESLLENTTGSGNIGLGYRALRNNVTGSNNCAVGADTMSLNDNGNSNSAFGNSCMTGNTSGYENAAFGASCLTGNLTGSLNCAFGKGALLTSDAIGNSAFGYESLNLTTGSYNTAIGYISGSTNETGSNNTFIGNNAQGASASASNAITLGDSAIATLRCQVTTITALSDRRDKKDIVDIPAGLNLVEKLRPVSFVWNMRDGGKVGIQEFGFIAQELQEAQSSAGVTVPNLVSEENPEKLEASAGTLIPVLVKAIQELKSELELVKSELASLKGV